MATSPRRLPSQPTPLIGRQRELQTVCGLLTRDDVRLVTLTGPGGTGKTRLGLEVAATLADRVRDGVAFVDLAPLDDPTMLIPSIAERLGVRDTGRRPLLELLTAHLCDRRLLLFLDNFDRIVSGATAVADLLGSCPILRILVTSRTPLHLRGEHDYPVPPLAVPEPGVRLTPDELSASPSVELFVQRVSDLDPAFVLNDANAATVAEICRRLDGLPLAIELAAARAKLLSPEAMLGRLDYRLSLLTVGARDLPDRHRTLRDTIAWSYDLLDQDGQRLFRRLSIFVGGFTLEAAGAIDIGADGAASNDPGASASAVSTQPSCLDMVGSLVDGSLLRRQDGVAGVPRYAMLDTIREYGLERLALAGEDVAIRRRHLAWCTAFVEYAETQVRGLTGPDWLDRLTAELDNVRAALAWSLTDVDETSARQGLRLAGAFFPVWYFRDHLDEGRRWLGRCLAADRERSPAPESVTRGANAGLATTPRPDDHEG